MECRMLGAMPQPRYRVCASSLPTAWPASLPDGVWKSRYSPQKSSTSSMRFFPGKPRPCRFAMRLSIAHRRQLRPAPALHAGFPARAIARRMLDLRSHWSAVVSLLASQQLKVFVPARDYAVSQQFYRALGFLQEDEVGHVTCFRHGAQCAFLLQDFYVRELAENLMLHLWVDDADAWWQHVHDSELTMHFQVTCSAPEDRPWGARDFTLHDPSGVLWRIGHPL